jgi:high-affinity Fe2+/Pb2+ permease
LELINVFIISKIHGDEIGETTSFLEGIARDLAPENLVSGGILFGLLKSCVFQCKQIKILRFCNFLQSEYEL